MTATWLPAPPLIMEGRKCLADPNRRISRTRVHLAVEDLKPVAHGTGLAVGDA